MSRRAPEVPPLAALAQYESELHNVNAVNFDNIALSLFRLQARINPIYRRYIALLGIHPEAVDRLTAIPFLPVSFFKTKMVIAAQWEEQATFLSSTTTSSEPSRHKIKSISFYHRIASTIFRRFYGPPTQFHFLALLPPYAERRDSSLLSMLHHFIQESKSRYSGFYLHDRNGLLNVLETLKRTRKTDKRKTILWGASFALMDFAEKYECDLQDGMVIETGGMKGKRKEIIRDELHSFLCHRFNVSTIHSEYGMTELLSQAYSHGKGRFQYPPWMRVQVRDLKDPFGRPEKGKFGGLNIIDLANIYTCAFIETQDIGRVREKGYFEVLGRIDNSDIRGCNLLVEG